MNVVYGTGVNEAFFESDSEKATNKQKTFIDQWSISEIRFVLGGLGFDIWRFLDRKRRVWTGVGHGHVMTL